MQMRPESRRSATRKKRSLFFLMEEVKTPSALTSEYLFRMLARGTRTWLNFILALSTPLRPSLWPRSSSQTLN